jgi:lipopolysaccharide heptosyltransferase II
MDRPFTSGWDRAENILCIRLDAIGDVLMTTPAFRALKDSLPGRRITLLTSPSAGPAARLVPEVDDVIVYDAPWMKATEPRADSRPEYRMAAQLNQAGFDAGVIFTVFSQNPLPAAFLCYLAGIPLRLAHCHENPYQLLTHWVLDREWGSNARHEVRRQLDLVKQVGAVTPNERLSLQVPGSAVRVVKRILINLGMDLDRPWIVIHAGATASSRRYPAESYAIAARQLVLDYGIQVVFTGSVEECELVRRIRIGMEAASYDLVGRLEFPEFAALLSLAPMLISNNTGPVHVAAAVGTPVVDLYALTNPQHTPWMVPSRVLNYDVPCKNCYKSVCPEGHNNCLRLVHPEEVVEAAVALLDETLRVKLAAGLRV